MYQPKLTIIFFRHKYLCTGETSSLFAINDGSFMFNSILVTPRFGGQYSFYAYYVFRKEIKYPIILPNEVFFYIEIRSLWNNYTVMTLEQFHNKQKKNI